MVATATASTPIRPRPGSRFRAVVDMTLLALGRRDTTHAKVPLQSRNPLRALTGGWRAQGEAQGQNVSGLDDTRLRAGNARCRVGANKSPPGCRRSSARAAGCHSAAAIPRAENVIRRSGPRARRVLRFFDLLAENQEKH